MRRPSRREEFRTGPIYLTIRKSLILRIVMGYKRGKLGDFFVFCIFSLISIFSEILFLFYDGCCIYDFFGKLAEAFPKQFPSFRCKIRRSISHTYALQVILHPISAFTGKFWISFNFKYYVRHRYYVRHSISLKYRRSTALR